MTAELKTNAEQRALAAEDLPVFQGIKLLHIKNSVMHLLSLIGREELFSEYTKHDISHIDAMLEMTDWVIPRETAEEMTPTDWLLLVLSIYLHDMGMVVTKSEYENRSKDRVANFAEEQLFTGEDGADYEARLKSLPQERREKFVFEEFIRDSHGQRVRSWLDTSPKTGSSVMHQEIADLAKPLPQSFRKDLGLVCESHHLDDLSDFAKYPLDKPYGNSPPESANVHYAALVLRTTDLLHITSDRTPPILFRTINPTNPVSQGEWIKQKAVRSVRPQFKTDSDGNLDKQAQPDTIEVFAEFDEPEGFFALTSYLVYAERQLQRSNEWASTAASKAPRPYRFPWRAVDEENIEVTGYLPQPYEFTVDQQRVLKLLTGHTLYNQTDVVVRELVQNSLDAVRLQDLGRDDTWSGKIEVEYDSTERLLRVTDNGTGMTLRMIEQHLLRVGASRYQDPEFRKQYPEFSAISRFGIGVLSTFMVADHVEILTAHADEGQPRQLTLRTVHGRYLMRLLDTDDDAYDVVLPHGTRVSLWLRPSATLGDVVDIMNHWIVVPRCEVTVSVDGDPPRPVGYANAGAALKAALKAVGVTLEDGVREIREAEKDGVHLAWAVQWSDYFGNWSVVRLPEQGREQQNQRLGLCVEGVRVEDGTPAYEEAPYAAVGNAVGPDAPKTNVARSGLEQTPQRLAAYGAVYSTMCNEVSTESAAMVSERGLSLTWATQEARWSLYPICGGKPRSWEKLVDAVKTVPTLLLEADGTRRGVAPREVEDMDVCWTVESNTFASAERMLRELAADVSISSLREAFGSHDLDLPDGPVVTGHIPGRLETNLAFENKEVSQFVIKAEQRRVDLRWEQREETPKRWRIFDDMVNPQRRGIFSQFSRDGHIKVLIANQGVDVVGKSSETAIKAFGSLFVLGGSPVSVFVNGVIDDLEPLQQTLESDMTLLFVELILREYAPYIQNDPERAEEILEQAASTGGPNLGRSSVAEVVSSHLDLTAFAAALRSATWSVFDPSQWLRDSE